MAANARLTALGGAALFVLLAAEGVTIPRLRFLLTPHLFIGLVLVPPLLLKLGSTGYRFARYYLRDPDYRAAGPPGWLNRVLGPVIVLSSVALMVSGVAAWVAGPYSDFPWLRIHAASFLVWFAVMTVHVLSYLGKAAEESVRDLARSRQGDRSARRRMWLVSASILAGVVIASIALELPTGWTAAFTG